jgi:glutamine synthetase
VAAGQWEFQIFAVGAKSAGDQIWVARYLLERLVEKHHLAINWHPKPLGKVDWNASGMHVNFSHTLIGTAGSKETIEEVL